MMKPNINRSIRQLFLRQKNLIYCLFLPPMKKIISVFSITVISLFVLAVFGWMSVHISKGDKDIEVFFSNAELATGIRGDIAIAGKMLKPLRHVTMPKGVGPSATREPKLWTVDNSFSR